MKKKVLLLGRSGSGKTSMRSIIFANYLAKETRRLGATIDVEHSNVRFLGNLVLNIWDCGGQESFMENYYVSQRERIFSNVEVLIYVFDVESQGDALVRDFESYQMCLDAITENSPFAQIFCLIHKMDLIQEDQKEKVFLEHKRMIAETTKPLMFTCFKTSIWEDTLYRAWSEMVHQLIPNMQELERSLKLFADIIECEEVLILERATLLIISSYARVENNNGQRFEKISNIIKGFKLSCSKMAAKFDTMEVRNANFALFVEVLTTNTYIMVVMSDSETPTALVSMNIKNSRKYFEVLERENEMRTTVVKQH